MLKKRINAKIPTALYEDVRRYMFENRVSLSEVIRRGIQVIIAQAQKSLPEETNNTYE